jgi:predicted RNA-binding protein with PIN domain
VTIRRQPIPDASLYLFDGYNLLHASPFRDPRELVDALASFVATQGARGVVVFDGAGEDAEHGPLAVRYTPNADTLLERLAAEHRDRERVVLVSSDVAVLETAGRTVGSLSSQTFFLELRPAEHRDESPGGLAGKLDPETVARLERLRRGE